MKSTSNLLDKIPNVVLDPNGVFKYIQIFVRDNSTNESKNVVRGYQKFKFHADNYEFFTKQIKAIDIDNLIESECVGGGRVNIDQDKKSIFVYGYSQAYGRCDHQLSCDTVKKDYPDYDITWSNDGY